MNMEAEHEEMKVSYADDEPCARAGAEERDAADSEAGRPRAVSAGGDVGWSEEEQQTCAWDLPQDLLAKCFLHLSSMKDMAAASMVSHRWRAGVKAAFVQKERLNFAGFRIDDSSMGRMVEEARNLLELDIHFNRWGSCITDAGLGRIASARCCGNLKRLSLSQTRASPSCCPELLHWSI